MRQNGPGTLTLEDARTWIEETGLSLFLPRRQFSPSVAPSFVEAIAGKPTATPDPKLIATAEALLVRLETDGVAVRLNLQGQPGEQPDFVVASWVLPYVYALRGDRDWRRVPQLTGSRQVSQLAVSVYKQLEQGDATVAQLKHTLGREVTEAAVIRAITELWQQLRIIPVIAAPGQPAKWQLLRHRFQKAIAEGASTSQVTAISVLASIFLQAVIAATMEEVEIFLSPLTSRSKIREVLRGLVATRQVHTISMGHAPHFYVAGTLPEFAPATSIYSSTYLSSSPYFRHQREHEEELPAVKAPAHVPAQPNASPKPHTTAEPHAHRAPVRKPAAASKPAAPRPHISRPAPHNREHKPAHSSRPARRGSESRPSGARSANSARPSSGPRWGKSSPKSASTHHGHNGKAQGKSTRPDGSTLRSSASARPAGHAKAAPPAWKSRSAAPGGKPAAKSGVAQRTGSLSRSSASRNEGRANRKPSVTASAAAGNSKRYGFTARPKPGTKKRG
ncbi:MAG: hypothetical protein WCA37_12085 [Terracidiphilus sp.]